MKPHVLYVWTHKSSIRLKVGEPNMYVINDATLEGISKGLKHTKWPSALAYDEMNILVIWDELL